MATTAITLSKTVWTKITAAGESGTCWKKTGETIIVDHTTLEGGATLLLSNVNVTVDKAKRVPLDGDSIDVLNLPADGASDVFYALAVAGTSNILSVDVI